MGFTAGYPNRVSWKADGNANYVELCNFRHGLTFSDEGHEVTSSCHEGIQAFIPSILRGEGDASFHIKTEQYPWNVSIDAQVIGMMQFEFGDRVPFYVPVYISRIAYTNETAGGSDYCVTFKLNAEAGTLS
jgi:hypothetical protein